MATEDAFLALFCPHCGACVNEPDLETEEEPVINRGSSYTCGWCGERTSDWNHVRRCRASYKQREHFKNQVLRIERIADLLGLREELQYG